MNINSSRPFLSPKFLEENSSILKSIKPKSNIKYLEDFFTENFSASSLYHSDSGELSILAWSLSDFFLSSLVGHCLRDKSIRTINILYYSDSAPDLFFVSSDRVTTTCIKDNSALDKNFVSLVTHSIPFDPLAIDHLESFSTNKFPFFTDSVGNKHISLLSLVLLLRDFLSENLQSLSPQSFKVSTQSCLPDSLLGISGSHIVSFYPESSLSKPTSRLIDFDTSSIASSIPLEAIKRGPQLISIYPYHAINHLDSFKLLEYELTPTDYLSQMITVFLNKGGGGNALMSAVAESLSCSTIYAEDYLFDPCGIPFVWGVLRNSKNVIDFAINNNNHFLYADHAYFSRGHGTSYRISANSFECNTYKQCPSDRIDLFDIDCQPWNKSGEKIIVCPPTEYFVEAHKAYGWLEKTLSDLKKYTNRTIIVRKKPKTGEKSISLAEQLKSAHALVTHSSNVAIESICYGTPVFVSETSAASPVGLSDLSLIEKPIYPDRDLWLNNLSYAQFTFDEIKSGSFFDVFKRYHSFSDTKKPCDES